MGDYLEPYRLEEVIRLIQVLGAGPDFTRGEDALRRDFKGEPKSIDDKLWVTLASEHPEFFRVHPPTQKTGPRVDLIARLRQDDEGQSALTHDRIHSLIALAMDLHERQARSGEVRSTLERLERETKSNSKKLIVNIVVAIVAALAAIVAAVIGLWAKK